MSISKRFAKANYEEEYAPYKASSLAHDLIFKPRFFRRNQDTRNGFYHPHRNFFIRYECRRIIPIKSASIEADTFL